MLTDDSPSRDARSPSRARCATRRLRVYSLLFSIMVIGMQSTTTAAEGTADAAFHREFGDAFFDRFWQLNPDWAIAVGYYKYADRLIVPDEKARAAQLEQDERGRSRCTESTRRSSARTCARTGRSSSTRSRDDRWSLTRAALLAVGPVRTTTSPIRSRCLRRSNTPRSSSGCGRFSRGSTERARVLRGGEAQRRESDARAHPARDRAEPRRARRVRRDLERQVANCEAHERGARVVRARGSAAARARSRTT